MNNPDPWSDVEPYQVQSNEPDAWSDVEPYVMPQAKQQESFQDPLSSLAHAGSRLGMMAGKGLALAQPAVFIPEIAGQALHAHYSSPSVQSANFRMNALEAAEHLEVQKAHGKWSDKDEERLQEFYKMGGMQNEEIEAAGGFHEVPNLSPTSLFKEAGKKIGIDTEARNILEKGVEFASMLATGRPEAAVLKAESYLPSNFNKVFTPAIKKHVKDTIKTAPIIVPSAVAEEATGLPMEVSMLVLGIGKGITQLAEKGVSEVGKRNFLFDPNNLQLRKPGQSRLDPQIFQLKELRKSFNKELGNSQKYVEEQVIKGLIKAKDLEKMKPFIDKAAEMGIPITPATLENSRYFRNMEKLIRENEMTAAEATEFRQKAAKDWADLTQKSLKEMETNLEFSTPGSTAESLLSDVTRQQHKKLVNEYTEGYSKSAKELKNSDHLEISAYREIEDSVNSVLDDVGESFFPTTAETSAKELGKKVKKSFTISAKEAGHPELSEVTLPTGKKALQAVTEGQAKKLEAQTRIEVGKPIKKSLQEGLKESREEIGKAETKQKQTFLKSEDDLKTLFGEDAKYMRLDENGHIRFVKQANGSTLVRTIQSLNKIVDWENPGIVNLYAHTRQTAKDILKRQYGKSNPEAIKNLEEANIKFGQTQKLFGKQSKWKKWGINSESTSEELLRTINSTDKLKQFEKDFGHTAQGKQYIDHLKHLKAKEMLDPIFSQREYTAGNVASGIDKLMKDKYFSYIVPDSVKANLKQIADIDAKIEQRSANFFTKHVPKDKQETPYLTVKNFFFKMGIKQTQDLSQSRRAEAFAQYLLDPSYTKKTSELMKTILEEMKKPNPNMNKISQSQALMQNIWNDLSQIAKVTSIENIPESE